MINLIKKLFIINKYILMQIYTSIYNIVFFIVNNNYCNNFIFVSSCCSYNFNAAGYSRNIHINISTTLVKSDNKIDYKDLSFNQWLAGLIDGDGYFILTKKGYTSCEITMDARDKKALNEIKHKYGGTIKSISNVNGVRYKLRHKKGLILLINDVNGLIRNPARLLQMNELCVKYDIKLKYPDPLIFNNGWLSGFIDSDGSIYYSEASGQVFISLTQKKIKILLNLTNELNLKINEKNLKINKEMVQGGGAWELLT